MYASKVTSAQLWTEITWASYLHFSVEDHVWIVGALLLSVVPMSIHTWMQL